MFQKLQAVTVLIAAFLLSSTESRAYVQNRTSSDSLVHWTSSMTVLDIFVNSDNTQGLNSTTIHNIATSGIAQWDGKSRLTLRKNSTAGTNQTGLNELYFSTDPSVFNGSGVVGITQVYYKNNTGEIIEADVLINDNYTFSTSVGDVNYLGNVITHEMGHFLGLGHSQVSGSTMFYALSRGQSQISADDKAGVYSIYPNGDSTKGALSGKVVGGRSLISVFGAHVQAISLKTGKVAGSNISDYDGTFTIDGLDKNDKYYLYTSPIAQVGLPSKYANAHYDFCDNSKKYRGSFFQKCGSGGEGFPQAVNLSSSAVNVGNVTIRCGLDVPVEYMQNKSVTPAVFDIQSHVQSGIGNAFTGYFSNQEITQNGIADYFRIDLSNFSTSDWSALSASGTLMLELRVLNQSFFSPFKANISVKRDSGTTNVSPIYQQESDGWLDIETVARFAINRSVLSDNNFEVTVTPESMNFPYYPAALPYTKTDYFPSSSYFEDSVYFYLVSASIVRDNGNSTYTLLSSKEQQLSDNTQCTDANNTYALTDFTTKGIASSSSSRKKDDGIACGTVDLQGGPGNGPGGFFIGLILSLILCHLTSKLSRKNASHFFGRL